MGSASDRPGPPSSGAGEAELIRRSQRGDQVAFEQLVRRFQPRVFSIIANLLRHTQEVEDLAQQVFVKLYFALPTFRFQSTLGTFVYRITVNECYDYLRRRRARETVEAPLLDEEQAERLQRVSEESAAATLSQAERVELGELVANLLTQATAEERVLLTLREIEGFSIRQIAQITGMNENTIKVKLFRARARLARLGGLLRHRLRK